MDEDTQGEIIEGIRKWSPEGIDAVVSRLKGKAEEN